MEPPEDPATPHHTAPALTLVQPTTAEILTQSEKNSVSWRGALTPEAYLRRELLLADQTLTRDDGMAWWALVSTAVDPSQRKVLAGCETLRKRALMARNGRVEDVVCYGVASVFVPPEYRGRNYGVRLMAELGDMLKTWQADKAPCMFSVLFSDIGKTYYAKHGWHPYLSTHIHLTPSPTFPHPPPTINLKLLHATELPALSTTDESLIRARLTSHSSSSPSTTTIAILPDAATLAWHHAKEDFVANELHGRRPSIKGALATTGTTPARRVWMVWTRVFGNPDPAATEGNTLHVLRVVVEDEDEAARTDNVAGLAAVLKVARTEAAEWGMREVEVWNPSALVLEAAREVAGGEGDGEVVVVERDTEEIASLKWFGDGEGKVEWWENEKFEWC